MKDDDRPVRYVLTYTDAEGNRKSETWHLATRAGRRAAALCREARDSVVRVTQQVWKVDSSYWDNADEWRVSIPDPANAAPTEDSSHESTS